MLHFISEGIIRRFYFSLLDTACDHGVYRKSSLGMYVAAPERKMKFNRRKSNLFR